MSKHNQMIGRRGEKQFSLLCSEAGVTCNQSSEDDFGWDMAIEFPPRPQPLLPLDMQRGPVAALVQVKATEGTAKSVQISLRTVVDLRRGAERDAFPTGAWAAKCEAITSDVGGHADPWVTFLQSAEPSASAVRDYILAFYRSVPFEERHIDLFACYFSALADGGGPLLVHCSGGKDRTGIAVALTHALLGVSHDDILHDYLLTNRHWNYEIHGTAVAAAMREEAGRPVDPAAVRAAIEVETEYLDAAFDVITARAGSVEGYLDKVVGIPEIRQRAIIARLVEVGP